MRRHTGTRLLGLRYATRLVLVTAMWVLAAMQPAQAQVTKWSLGDADGNWSTAGNWDNGVPNSSTADAQFLEADLMALRTITLTENIVVNAIRFTDKDTPHFQLEISPTSPYTITFAGTNPVIQSGSYSGGDAALRIFAPVVVDFNGLTKIGSGSAAFMNTISGSGTLTFSEGTTELRGDSTGFTGNIVIDSGAVVQARGFSGASVLGDTTHGTTIKGTGQFSTRDADNRTISELFILEGIRDSGSVRCYNGTNITLNGPVTLNSDSSFAVADWKSDTDPKGDVNRFFINSVIADGVTAGRSAHFLTDLSSASYRGTDGRKSEIILGGQSTYGGNTYLTTNYADDGSGTFSGNLRLGVNNALPVGTTLVLGGASSTGGVTLGTGAGSGKFALSGYNQELAGLITNGTGALNRVVGNSATLSTLTLNIASGTTNTCAGYLGWTDTNDNNLALVKTGTGTLVLSGANTYTGTTTVSAGTLTIRGNSALGSSAALSGTTVAGGAVLKLEGGITVAEPITITGSGIGWSGALHNASGNNTWSGPITISGYTRIGAATGTLFTLSGGITGSSAIFGSDTGIIRIVDKAINVGTNGITVLNNGTVELNVGGNTWGSTTIEYGGTLKLGLDDAMPTTTVVRIGTGTTNGTFDLNAHNQTIAGLYDGSTGTRRVVNSGGGTPTLTINNSNNYTYAGVLGIAGQGSFNLTKTGSGTMTLAGANVYTGLTTVSGGVLALGHASALGATGAGTLVNTGGVLDLNGFNTAEPVTLNGGTLRNSVASTPITEFNGTLTLASQSEINSPVALSLVGQITGTGGFTKTGGEQIRLFNTANNYQGPTIVEAGYVDIMTSEVIPDTSNLTLNSYLNLRGYTETIGGLSGNGSGFLYSSPGSGTLRIGGGNADGSYEGRILDNGGQVSIVKVGTGTQVFSGLTNIYTGTTRVEGGTLLVNGVHTGGGAYTVNAGATLGGTGTVGGATTIMSGGILAPGSSVGLLTFNNSVWLQDGATFAWEFLQTGTAGTDYDSIAGTDLILPETGKVNLTIAGLDGYTIKAGDSFTLFEGNLYQGLTPLASGTNLTDRFTISDNIGWWGTWEVTAGSLVLTAVPEPSSLLLLAALAGLLVGFGRSGRHRLG
ncbi:MAG: autotransporter-associated beta strand repeat-containing protein [Patescibacteria group bacterium]|nr:autotransporter-associated beta strand repeat-containing protein [Patescibacteria group bacterium]